MLMREQIDEQDKMIERLQLLLIQCFKKTNDPEFEEKLRQEIEQQIIRRKYIKGPNS